MLLLLKIGFFIPLFIIGFLGKHQNEKTAAPKAAHPFYVSVTEINHNSKDKTLEISCRIFADDMEEVLKKNYKTPVDLTNEKQQAQNNKYISDYISRHLVLTADGKKAPLTYIGFEKESEAVYCYFEVSSLPAVHTLDVVNSLLQDLTDKQINILHVMIGGKRQSYKLDYPQKEATFKF